MNSVFLFQTKVIIAIWSQLRFVMIQFRINEIQRPIFSHVLMAFTIWLYKIHIRGCMLNSAAHGLCSNVCVCVCVRCWNITGHLVTNISFNILAICFAPLKYDENWFIAHNSFRTRVNMNKHTYVYELQ